MPVFCLAAIPCRYWAILQDVSSPAQAAHCQHSSHRKYKLTMPAMLLFSCMIMQVLAKFYKTFLALRKLPIVSIAAINGAAVGGGMGLAAAADIRLAASNARLGYNFVKLGLSPGVTRLHSICHTTKPQHVMPTACMHCTAPGHGSLQVGCQRHDDAAQSSKDSAVTSPADSMAWFWLLTALQAWPAQHCCRP